MRRSLPAAAAFALLGAASLVSAGRAAAVTTSTYEAGQYLAAVSVHTATTQFRVPEAACAGANGNAVFLGIGDQQSEGVASVLAVFYIRCLGDTAAYSAYVVVGNKRFFGSLQSAPHDLITASVKQISQKETATVEDADTGRSIHISNKPTPDTAVLYGCLPVSDNHGVTLEPPQFVASLRDSQFNGAPLTEVAPTRINRADSGATIMTSKLHSSDKFSLTVGPPAN